MRVEKLKKLTKKELVDEQWFPIKEVAKKKHMSITALNNKIERGELKARNFYGRVFVLQE
jgi:predicted DNA-binding ribbon-helix-helix protein